jgi:hypothetical protein
MNARGWGFFLIVLGVLILGAAALVSYEAVGEAFGAGPPYYSRTTNMDKWSNPLPELLLGDAVAVLAGGLLMRAGIRKVRTHMK